MGNIKNEQYINFFADGISNLRAKLKARYKNIKLHINDTPPIIKPPKPIIVGSKLTGTQINAVTRVTTALTLSRLPVGNSLKPASL